jgi:hypothetical protein
MDKETANTRIHALLENQAENLAEVDVAVLLDDLDALEIALTLGNQVIVDSVGMYMSHLAGLKDPTALARAVHTISNGNFLAFDTPMSKWLRENRDKLVPPSQPHPWEGTEPVVWEDD